MKGEKGGITFARSEPKLNQSSLQPLKPGPRHLIEAIKSSVELTNQGPVCSLKARKLLHDTSSLR